MKKVGLYLICFCTCIFAKGQNADIKKESTASKNVQIFDTAFYIPQLDRKRRVWIYLPKDYSYTTKKYPVLYLQDGQNVFDKATSFIDEWGVDECLDTLIEKGVSPSIVIAVDNGSNFRMTEYNPYHHQQFGNGEGISM